MLFLKEPEASPMIAQLGGTGIGDNPSVSGGTLSAPTGSGAGGSSSVGSSGGGPVVSGQLHATIANQNELGPPAPRSAPC